MRRSKKTSFPFHMTLLILLLITGCKEDFVQGRRLYEGKCAGCHMHDGTGLERITPPLFQSDYLKAHIRQLPCRIRYGQYDTIRVNGVIYTDFMLGFPDLTDVEITNICNYISYKFLNQKTPGFSPPLVKKITDSCALYHSAPANIPYLRDSVRMFESI